MRYGFHLGGSQQDIEEAIPFLEEHKIDLVQIFVGSPMSVNFPKRSKAFDLLSEKVDIVIHSPYWVSFFNPKVYDINNKYIQWMCSEFKVLGKRVRYVTHIGSPKEGMSQNDMADHLHERINRLDYDRNMLDLYLENTSGYKNVEGLGIEFLQFLARFGRGINFCLDTEHAYAAGEEFGNLKYDELSLVHLNAIPQYVKFGAHLDRHSWCPLEKSKEPIWKVIDGLAGKDVDLIMERRDINISIRDIDMIKKYVSRKES